MSTDLRATRPASALAVPAFRRLWAAGLISDTGDWMLFVALPLVVLQLTGSALGASLAFLLELAPAIVLAPLASRLASRFDRRRLLIAVNIGQAVVLAPLLWIGSAADLPILYGVIAAHACLATLFEPAKNSLLPELVPEESLVSANALVGLNQNLGRLVGGPLGGIALSFGGLGFVAATDVASYVISALLIALIRMPGHGSADAAGSVGSARAPGILRALVTPGLRAVFLVTFVASIAQGMFLVLFVLWVFGPLHGSQADAGILRGVQAIGAIGAGLGIGLLARRADAAVLTAHSLLAFGVLSLVTWNLPVLTAELWPYVVLYALVGAPGVIMTTGIVTTLQRASAAAALPAAFAALGLVMAAGQALGILAAGLSDGPLGLVPLLQVQGCLYLAAGAVAVAAARSRKGLRREA